LSDLRVVSTNIGSKTNINWKGSTVETGIYKYPSETSIELGSEDVVGDHVSDRLHHGGVDKAFYVYSQDHYPYWKERYPDLDLQHGFFGENLTVSGCDEQSILIGSVYKIGTALVQVSQPRQPCFKLGIRFGTQDMLKQFIDTPYCGVYFRVLQPGIVKREDVFKLLQEGSDKLTIADVFQLIYLKESDNALTTLALKCESLPETCKASILRKQTGV